MFLRYECGISASYPCSLCGRKFKRRDVLKGHMEKCVNKSSAAAAQAAAQAFSAAAAQLSPNEAVATAAGTSTTLSFQSS